MFQLVNEDEHGCWSDTLDPDPEYPDDSECPTNTNEVVFLPGELCEEYYICINGVPSLFECRQGQHWNIEKEYCDDPHAAGCDVRKIKILKLSYNIHFKGHRRGKTS